ncbi:MAG: hypothetical protein V1804_03390, partial [Patescibacteria group bacterium]
EPLISSEALGKFIPSSEIMRKFYLSFIILLLAAFLQAGFAFSASAQNAPGKVLPRIDDEAAYTERPAFTPKEATADKGDIYPQKFWVFLFGAYLFILLFNLSFGFKSGKTQWFWEIVYTFLAIFAWDKLDVARNNIWFPKIIAETGIIIYLFYFYHLQKRIEFNSESEKEDSSPKQEKLL